MLRDGPGGPTEVRLLVNELTVGEVFLVRPGGKVATDGEVISGITVDDTRAARAVAERVGIQPGDVIAEVLPAEKVDAVRRLQETGATVAMVG